MKLALSLGDRSRRVLVRLAMAAFAAVVALLIGEGALRVLDRARPETRYYVGEQRSRESDNFVADQDTGWRMRPSHRFQWITDGRAVEYQSDEKGFRVALRGESDSGPFPSSAGRLVVCGDSFAFGTGVTFQETFGAQVAVGLGLVATNLAMPGFGVDQVARSVTHQALRERPSLLLVALYPEDFDRSFTAYRVKEGFAKPRFELDADGLREQNERDRPWGLWRACSERSHLIQALRIAVRRIGREHGTLEWWRLNEALLDSICGAAGARGVPIAFAFIPSKFWRPFPALRAWAEDRGVVLLDPVIDSDLDPSGMYYERDAHLNAEGHRRLGAWFTEQVRARFPDLEYP